MAQRICECGIRYDPSVPEQDAGHRERHDEWANGVKAPAGADDRVLASWEGNEVVLITVSSPPAQREVAARVALRARQDTPFPEPAFKADDRDPSLQVFLARREGRAMALAVFRRRVRWAWWTWDDWDAERRPATPVAPLDTWTAELLWSHSRIQQRGIARKLLHEAAKLFEQPTSSFGWRRPFTPSGEALVRRLCPEGFWEPE